MTIEEIKEWREQPKQQIAFGGGDISSTDVMELTEHIADCADEYQDLTVTMQGHIYTLRTRVKELEANIWQLQGRRQYFENKFDKAKSRIAELEQENERDRCHGRDFIRLWNEGKNRITALESELEQYRGVAMTTGAEQAMADYKRLEQASNKYQSKYYDLLAVIHRDGGHYLQAHGEGKAGDDAIILSASRGQRIEELEQALERIITNCGTGSEGGFIARTALRRE